MTLRRYQTQRTTNETWKEGLKSYADMTIYAMDPARLVPKCVTTNFLQLL